MKIFPISDSHLEVYQDNHWSRYLYNNEDKYRGAANLVVCAGDMNTGGRGPVFLREIFGYREIIYVAGNHEYYNSSILEQDTLLAEECKKYGIHYLQRQTLEIDGVIFAGCTLWTDFDLFGVEKRAWSGHETAAVLADYDCIYTDDRKKENITWQQVREINQKDLAWLKSTFDEYRDNKLVVVTHHAPSRRMIQREFLHDKASAGFASNLDGLVAESGCKYWICGHTHVARQAQFKGGQGPLLVQNAMGYRFEPVDGFDPELILEIKE